jgi:hypothetical protein
MESPVCTYTARVRGDRMAKGRKRTGKPLPSVDARQRTHGNVANGNAIFAVRHALYARQRPLPCHVCVAVRQARFAVECNVVVRRLLCHAAWLCHAPETLPCGVALPCAGRCHACDFVMRQDVAVRGALPCGKKLPCVAALPCAAGTARTAKAVLAHLASSQGAQVGATWVLCHAHAHDKVTKWSFAVRIRTAKNLQYFLFFLFSFNSLHFKIANTYICIYI